MSDYVSWLHGIAARGGKGVVGNIDARCLGRVADELVTLRAERNSARADLAEALEALRKVNDALMEVAEHCEDRADAEMVNGFNYPNAEMRLQGFIDDALNLIDAILSKHAKPKEGTTP